MIITFPIPGLVSAVCLAVFWLSGNGVQFAPGLPSGLVDLALFFLGKLLVEDEFFHNVTSSWFLQMLLLCDNYLYPENTRMLFREKGSVEEDDTVKSMYFISSLLMQHLVVKMQKLLLVI